MNFSQFFQTATTITEGHGFSLFGPLHLLWLLGALALFVILFRAYRRWSATQRRRCMLIIAALLLLDELVKHVCSAATGRWEVQFLPLHLCSVNVFLCSLYAWKPSDRLAELLYCQCLPGAAAALLFPSWTSLPLLNFMHLHSFTIHILLVLAPLLILAGGFRPNWRRLPRCVAMIVLFCVPVYFLNKLLGTNFIFLNEPGTGNPLTLFATFWGNPGYLLGVPIILALLWPAMYLPWQLAGRKAQKGA